MLYSFVVVALTVRILSLNSSRWVKSSEATVLWSGSWVRLPAAIKDCFYCCWVAADPLIISRGLAKAHNLHRVSHRNHGDQHIKKMIIKE